MTVDTRREPFVQHLHGGAGRQSFPRGRYTPHRYGRRRRKIRCDRCGLSSGGDGGDGMYGVLSRWARVARIRDTYPCPDRGRAYPLGRDGLPDRHRHDGDARQLCRPQFFCAYAALSFGRAGFLRAGGAGDGHGCAYGTLRGYRGWSVCAYRADTTHGIVILEPILESFLPFPSKDFFLSSPHLRPLPREGRNSTPYFCQRQK